MTPEEFRAAAHELVDWIADRRATVEQRRVLPDVAPGEIAAGLPAVAPSSPVASEAVLSDLERLIAPGITEVQHPMHFGWFPANASLSSVLGDFASSGLASLGISWESSPSLTEVEEVVLDWIRQLSGMSESWRGVIQDTASTACVVAMVAARERATDHAQAGGGLGRHPARLTVYATSESHSSVRKAALLAGFAADDIRLVAVDPWTRDMDTDDLARQIEVDIAAGLQPTAVVATVGTTGVTAIDSLAPIGEIADANDVWLHVDAAMAGATMLLPEMRHHFEGLDLADSFSWNPAKWLGTILDTSLFWVQDPNHLIRVMSTNPSYLRATASDAESGSESEAGPTQYRDWGIPLGRRFRALKLWYQLHIDGVEAIQGRLRRDIANAGWFAEAIAARPGWRVVAPTRLQTVCVRHIPPGLDLDDPADRVSISEHNFAWARSINQSGAAFLSPSLLDDIWMVRVSVGVEATERRHLEKLLKLMDEAVAEASV